MYRSLLVALLIAVAGAAPASATPFTATYTFTGSPGDQASEPVDSHPVGALLSDITRGPGIDAHPGLNSMNSDGWTTAMAPDPDDFYEMTITPLAGYDMDVTAFTFTFQRSEVGPHAFQLRYSLDGFAAPIFTGGFGDTTSNLNFSFSNTNGLGGEALNLSSPLTLRIYAYGAEDAEGAFRLGIDSSSRLAGLPNILELQGDLSPTAVPEPTSLLLFGSGAAVSWAKARRRTKARVQGNRTSGSHA
jgi:hypothetical protein